MNDMSTSSLEKSIDIESARCHDHLAHHDVPLDYIGTGILPRRSAYQPDPHKPSFRKFANPAPLGLFAVALTMFVSSLVSIQASGLKIPAVIAGSVYFCGGAIQLMAGMWEMVAGNTLGATALCSYGSFWISLAMIDTDFLRLASAYDGDIAAYNNAIGFFLMGWFIFTSLLCLCTFKSSLACCSLFVVLDITFLLLSVSYLDQDAHGAANVAIGRAGGVFGLMTAFIAWWNAIASLLETSNSFFTISVLPFPWSEEAKKAKFRGD